MLRWQCILLALFCAGCGPKEQARLPVFTVQGKVMLNGKPAEKIMVVLHPLGELNMQGAPKPNAKTNNDGIYAISTYDAKDGAPAGKYAVLLYWFRSEADEDGITDRFAGKYSNPLKPVMTVEIHDGENQLKTIELN